MIPNKFFDWEVVVIIMQAMSIWHWVDPYNLCWRLTATNEHKLNFINQTNEPHHSVVLAYICHLFAADFSNVCYFAAFWPTELKFDYITNFVLLFLVMGFISLVDEISYNLC